MYSSKRNVPFRSHPDLHFKPIRTRSRSLETANHVSPRRAPDYRGLARMPVLAIAVAFGLAGALTPVLAPSSAGAAPLSAPVALPQSAPSVSPLFAPQLAPSTEPSTAPEARPANAPAPDSDAIWTASRDRLGAADLSTAERMTLELYDLINRYRAENGLYPLALDGRLTASATAHAADMAAMGRCNHTGSDGSSARNRMARYGYPYNNWAGENIICARKTPERALAWWKTSTPHRKNLLHQNFTHIGVGFNPNGPWGPMWALNFAAGSDTTAPLPALADGSNEVAPAEAVVEGEAVAEDQDDHGAAEAVDGQDAQESQESVDAGSDDQADAIPDVEPDAPPADEPVTPPGEPEPPAESSEPPAAVEPAEPVAPEGRPEEGPEGDVLVEAVESSIASIELAAPETASTSDDQAATVHSNAPGDVGSDDRSDELVVLRDSGVAGVVVGEDESGVEIERISPALVRSFDAIGNLDARDGTVSRISATVSPGAITWLFLAEGAAQRTLPQSLLSRKPGDAVLLR